MRSIAYPDKGFLGMPGGLWVWGRGGPTTAGALSTATPGGIWAKSPMVITKVAATAGRYKLQLPNPYFTFLGGIVTLIGPLTAAYGANTTGLDAFLRAENIDAVNGTVVDGSVLLQFSQSSYADAEVPDGTIFTVGLCLSEGT